MLNKCTHCETDAELQGDQRVCPNCKKLFDDKSLAMASLLRKWMQYSAIADDAPLSLETKTFEVLEGLPR